jgi:hypothetical protein
MMNTSISITFRMNNRIDNSSQGRIQGGGVLVMYTPLRNDFVPLSLVNLVYSYTWKVPYPPLHPPKKC